MRSTALAALLLLAPVPALADPDCTLHRLASIDMSISDDGRVFVPMTVSGKTVSMLVDTGGIISMLTESSIKALGLTPITTNVELQTYGGKILDRYAIADDVQLDRLKAPSLNFFIMPDRIESSGAAGTLAPDILRAYDSDFDFMNGKLNLFSQAHCPGAVVWWTKDYTVVDFHRDTNGHIAFSVQLDGKEVPVIIDTGASRSEMSLEMVRNVFGIDTSSPGMKAIGEQYYVYPFKTLVFSGITVNNPDILLVHDTVSKVPDTIIGMSILRQLHVYIAWHENKMYLSAASATLAPAAP